MLSDNRTKLYFIEHEMLSVIELNLKTMSKRTIRVRRLTTLTDRVFDIFSYKSKLYGITRQGFAFILNTVQNKVLFRRKLEGYSDSSLQSMIARSKDTIVISQNLGTSPTKPLEDQYKFTIFNKGFLHLASFHFSSLCTEKEAKVEERSPTVISNLSLIPNTKGRPLILISLDGSTYPLRLFTLSATGQAKEAAKIGGTTLSDRITAMKYCQGHVFLSSRDKKIRRFSILF